MTSLILISIQRSVKKQFAPSVELALNKPSPDMWDKVLKAFRSSLEKAEGTYLRKAKSKHE
jgi:flavin reductase (DIM6/NTAB) family NADH-FMN oxidoreductase RutF